MIKPDFVGVNKDKKVDAVTEQGQEGNKRSVSVPKLAPKGLEQEKAIKTEELNFIYFFLSVVNLMIYWHFKHKLSSFPN